MPIDRSMARRRASSTRLIVVPSRRASWRTRYAAGELARYASRILGRKVRVTDSTKEARGHDVVLVGLLNDSEITQALRTAGFDAPRTRLGDEGFIIEWFKRSGGRGLLIAGETDLGILYGVYHYLERCCRVGFFWSADNVPRLKRLPLEGIHLVENPRFAERFMTSPGGYSFSEFWAWPDWRQDIEYRVKKKHNLISIYLGYDLVWREVLSRHGVAPKPLTKSDVFRDRLAKQVYDYARKLGLRTITPAFMGDVPSEFAAANPNVRYVEMKKWDLTSPRSRHIYPTDPMFKTLGEEFLKAYAAKYGTDHYYFTSPYPEAYPGATPEEKRSIKLDFAKAVQEYMTAADPEWRWLADSWTFFTGEFWPLEEVKAFCLATDTERFTIYDTWGEERPLYRINNYYHGRFWTLGVLHCFGGNTTLRGDLQGLIDSVQSIDKDPKADHCKGIFLVPEVIHHNDLYFDLIMTLWWNPGSVTLDGFIQDYAERRYGSPSARRMARVLGKLAGSIHSDSDLTQPLFLRRPSSGFDTPNTEQYVPPVHATYALDVGDAISTALEESRPQRSNTLYWRDLVDMARRYYGDLFNQWISRLYYAFDAGDRKAFEAYRGKLEKCLDAIEGVLWSWRPYSLEFFFSKIRKTPAYDPAREKATRDMLSLWESENLHDYERRDDVAELFTNYYRRRVSAYLDHLQLRLGAPQPGIDPSSLEAAYTQAGRAWIEGPWVKPRIKHREDPLGAVKAAFKGLRATRKELVRSGPKALRNPAFRRGFTGWHVTRSRLETRVEKQAGPGGAPAVFFEGRTSEMMKYLTIWQDLKARDDLAFELDWILKAFGPSARAGLRVEVFDARLCKKAELTYQFGEGGDYWPDRTRPDIAGPDWAIGVDARLEWWTGFYAVKRRVGKQLDAWMHLTAVPKEDLDGAHGNGTWARLEPALMRISLIASSRQPEDPIAGAFANLRVSRREGV